jgi:hypothetical protein
MNRARPARIPQAELVQLLRDALASWTATLRLLLLAIVLLPLTAATTLAVLQVILALQSPDR